MRLTWIAEGNSIKGSVVITASLSPTAKSTDLAGESKLKVNNCWPVCTFHSLAVWSALPVMSRPESPEAASESKLITISINIIKKLNWKQWWRACLRRRSTKRRRCGRGRCRGVRRCRRTRRWGCGPWRRRKGDRRPCCTWGTSVASRGLSSESASCLIIIIRVFWEYFCWDLRSDYANV